MASGGGGLYWSTDFKNWSNTKGPWQSSGDCPSFFPLPTDAMHDDAGRANDENLWVYRYMGRGEVFQIGVWTPAAPSPDAHGHLHDHSNFTASPGISFSPRFANSNTSGAGKDFWDPVKKRRLYFAMARGAQILARHITYNAPLDLLLFAPIEEQSSLRANQTASLTSATTLDAGKHLWLPQVVANSSAPQLELVVRFSIPPHKAFFGVGVGVVAGHPGVQNKSTRVFVDYNPPPPSSDATASSASWYGVTVGIDRTGSLTAWGINDTLRLLRTDTEIELRVFLDNVSGAFDRAHC